MQANEAYEARNSALQDPKLPIQKNNNVPNAQLLNQLEQLKQELELLKTKKEIDDYNRRIYLYNNQLPNDYEVVKSDPNLQVRGFIKIGNICTAYNSQGDMMNLSYDECNYYSQEVGRVHKPNQSQSEPKKGTL